MTLKNNTMVHLDADALEFSRRKQIELEQYLAQPIEIHVDGARPGDRWVYVIPPWGVESRPERCRADGGISDRRGVEQNPRGVMGFATGYEGYYCSVNAQEMRLFALELLILSTIAQNWEAFFENPESFVARRWSQLTQAVGSPDLTYKLVWLQ